MPSKRHEKRAVSFLDSEDMEAFLAAPDRTTWVGRRDHLILLVALQAGLRASELIGLRRCDVVLGASAHIRCEGKGRKERSTPLRRETARLLEAWIRERNVGEEEPLFPTLRGDHLSRDALERLVRRHGETAARSRPSLAGRNVSPHVLRHSTAMELLRHGADQSVIALWLGHESVETTQIYLHADLKLKETALARIAAPEQPPGRYRPDDQLLAFLEAL
jgi:integrase